MSKLAALLFASRLIFPLISPVTGIISVINERYYKKNVSPIFVPFIGPLLLTGVIAYEGYPLWWIQISWIVRRHGGFSLGQSSLHRRIVGAVFVRPARPR